MECKTNGWKKVEGSEKKERGKRKDDKGETKEMDE